MYERLQSSGLPIETSTGGRTKWNRTQRNIPKAHWLDATNVGQSTPPRLLWQHARPLHIRAMGQQSRQMCRMRMAARANGAFTIATRRGIVTDIGYRYCTRLQRNDGYGYLIPSKKECSRLPVFQ